MKKIIAIIITLALVVGMTAIFASAEESLVSQGKDYVRTGAYIDDAGKHYYPDNGDKQLTDGVKAVHDDIGYESEVWVGFNTLAPDCSTYAGKGANSITVDLGEETECSKYVLYSESFDCGITAPAVVAVETSVDGVEWKLVGEAEGTLVESYGNEEHPAWGLYEFTVSGKINAQYVKFTAAHVQSWVFISEVEVYAGGDAEPVPEDPAEDPSEDPADNTSSEEPVANTSEESPAESSAAEAEESKAEESKVEESKPASSEEGANLTWLWIVIAVVVVAGVVVAVVLGKKKK